MSQMTETGGVKTGRLVMVSKTGLYVLLVFASAMHAQPMHNHNISGLERILGEETKVSISPNTVTSESFYTFKIQITLGQCGLSANDSLGLVCGSYIDRWNFEYPSHFWTQPQPWQTEEPEAANFTNAICNRKGANLSVKVGVSGGRKPFHNQPGHFVRSLRERMRYVLEISSETDLKQGDVITVTWGDRNHNGPGVRAPAFATKYYFLPFKYSLLPKRDRDLPIRRGEFEQLPSICVKGKESVRLYVTAQPLRSVKDGFSLNIAAVDEYGNLSEDFTGQIRLRCDAPQAKLPKNVKLTAADKGHRVVDDIQIAAPGWYKIEAVCDDVRGKSNYLRISEERPVEQIYFGDMHNHTLDCDGTPWHPQHYYYARNVAGLDFGTISCHAEYFGCKEAWDTYLRYATAANEPGRFVTFYGYEWAGGGHINAYFLNKQDVSIFYGDRLVKGRMPDDPPFRTPCTGEDRFIEYIKAVQQKVPVFLIAHCHTSYTPAVDDQVLWLDEIYSCHKRDRTARESRYRDNLERGLYLGVVAASDMHRLLMGHLCKQPGELWMHSDKRVAWSQYQTAGLQATFAPKLTQQSIYTGMKKRHTYGTTGERIVLLFDIDGENIMGDHVTVNRGRKPKLNIQVGGTDKISEVAICKFDGQVWSEVKKTDIKSDLWIGSWKDAEFSNRAIYYVRVTQSDGGQAWSSPIWAQERSRNQVSDP